MTSSPRIRGAFLFALLVAVAAGGCHSESASVQKEEVRLLQSPAVGDCYAAELTYFSDADFEQRTHTFGLMKVVAVDGDEITLITENGGVTDRRVALDQLAGSTADTSFDDTERIILRKADLLRAHQAGKVFGVRR